MHTTSPIPCRGLVLLAVVLVFTGCATSRSDRPPGETQSRLDAMREEFTTVTNDFGRREQGMSQTFAAREKELLRVIDHREEELRKVLGLLADMEKETAGLKETVRQLQEKGQTVDDHRVVFLKQEDTIADLNKQIILLKQGIDVQEVRIKSYAIETKQLRASMERALGRMAVDSDKESSEAKRVPPGDKGKITEVDQQWGFVTVSFTGNFLKEFLGEDMNGQVPEIHLLVRKSGERGKFASKIRLKQIDAVKKLGLANMMTEWKQLQVEVGDTVYY
jgi:hypothetical protein